jgi:hypothetical protein
MRRDLGTTCQTAAAAPTSARLPSAGLCHRIMSAVVFGFERASYFLGRDPNAPDRVRGEERLAFADGQRP